ncbi:ATP-binding protein [Niallia sp. Krafla_26]|uniref:ATP-binding protein n=1 Tax=Niallia sp. Krafla_26 TaxID=3064703 RepID=UPI003D1778DD
MTNQVALTKSIKAEQGSHILYFYNSMEAYIQNACSYIEEGIQLGQHVVIIEREILFQEILIQLGEVDKTKLLFVDRDDFYETYHDFRFERILSNFKNIITPYVDQNLTVRIWGHIDWIEQDNMLHKLHTYECICDITIAEIGYTTVCCYNANDIPATFLLEMMKSHEVLMTDDSITRNSLYKSSNVHNPTIYPSLSAQRTIDSEMDLYRQKLDFVHVVSHEVRNPLTVIKAYARLLAEEEIDDSRQKRLQEIINYSVVIDNEISHIISTEQMLLTDALWRKKLILVKPSIDDVLEIMTIKAMTQNRTLYKEIDLDGKEMLVSNSIGFRLIISNLLSNAIKYSYENSAIFFSVWTENDLLMIRIKDEGIGMSEEQLDKLFKKYEKSNQEVSGQGIGLFMVKKLVDHFDGTIQVRSSLGNGTTFQVCLPVQK